VSSTVDTIFIAPLLLYWILDTDFAVDFREFPTSAHLSGSGCCCFWKTRAQLRPTIPEIVFSG
jgi:hypothetical protein